jgi:hypothetical protein
MADPRLAVAILEACKAPEFRAETGQVAMGAPDRQGLGRVDPVLLAAVPKDSLDRDSQAAVDQAIPAGWRKQFLGGPAHPTPEVDQEAYRDLEYLELAPMEVPGRRTLR